MNDFASLGLSQEVLDAIQELGFETPTPIQAESIPVLLNSKQDVLGFAQTGTGKTAAFSLPIVERVDHSKKHVQALILCPTRELCMQIKRDIASFSKYLHKINVTAIYGGDSASRQIKDLDRGAQIVVGTPGRVKDLMNRGKLRLGKVDFLVLDEADDMLDKGFKDDLDEILDQMPEDRQTLLFSATMSQEIRRVVKTRMTNPKEVKVSAQNLGADSVQHHLVTVHSRDRYAALCRLLDANPDVYGIVFCRTRRQTQEIASKLITHKYSAEAIHGDIDQRDRSRTMERFRKRQIQILVATDVAARGIDVDELTHVINYELPDSPETYVHRSGRTGRAGNSGISIAITHMKEKGKIRRIESIMKKQFTQIPVPTGDAICEAQLMSLIHRVKNVKVDTKKLGKYLPAIQEELAGMSYNELIQHFVSVEFNRLLDHYSNEKDISTHKMQKERREPNHRKRAKNVKFNSYWFGLGKKDRFRPKDLFNVLNKHKHLRGIEIGDIKIGDTKTSFQADSKFHKELLKMGFKQAR